MQDKDLFYTSACREAAGSASGNDKQCKKPPAMVWCRVFFTDRTAQTAGLRFRFTGPVCW
jgi:hypothetical protein